MSEYLEYYMYIYLLHTIIYFVMLIRKCVSVSHYTLEAPSTNPPQTHKKIPRTLLPLCPACQMYRYDAYWLPTGPIEASWECRLAGCWLCSHGNWLEPCVWPHEGHIKAGLQGEAERGKQFICYERETVGLTLSLNAVPCMFVCHSLKAESRERVHI